MVPSHIIGERMNVVFGTLGWRPHSLVPTLKATPDVAKLIFYHSDHPDTLKARDSVVDYCESMGIAVRPVELTDAFNFLETAKRIREDVRAEKEAGNQVSIFNIGGGTRLTSSAALLVCILEGIPATYRHDETGEEIRLPLLRIEYSAALSDMQRKVLAHLVDHGNEDLNETALASAMGLHKATINHHVKELVRKGVVEVAVDPGDARSRIVRAAPAAELLLE
jgi:DNA-binding MarR family transcriptional regulator